MEEGDSGLRCSNERSESFSNHSDACPPAAAKTPTSLLGRERERGP